MSFLKFHRGIRDFYKKYKKYIIFNKELGISETVSLITGAVAAELALILTKDPVVNSIASLAGDYSGSYSVFMTMHYYDNEKSYKGSKWKLISDMFKIVPFLVIAEPVYIVSKLSLHYIMLTAFNQAPFVASVISDLISTAMFFIVINSGAKITGFLKK